MTTTYEVSVYPQDVFRIIEMRHWCMDQTDEYDDSVAHELVELDGEPMLVQEANLQQHVYTIISQHWTQFVGEVQFYFFNELDAVHFKLRFAEFL